MACPGPELYLILVSLHEATGSITTQPWTGCKSIPLSSLLPPPPFTPLAFYQVSLTNFCYPFILLGGDRHCKSKVFCTRTQHIDWNPDLLTLSPAQARLQMQTSWPWVHLTNHKNTMSPQEGRVYDESFVIRNKLIIKPKRNSLIWFLNRDYWSKLIKDIFL